MIDPDPTGSKRRARAHEVRGRIGTKLLIALWQPQRNVHVRSGRLACRGVVAGQILFPRSQANQGMGAMPPCPGHDDIWSWQWPDWRVE